MSEGIDALAQDWKGENNYVNPPWVMLPQVLDKILQDKAMATVIAPVWPSQAWFHKLTSLLTAPPILLPRNRQTLAFMGVRPEPRKNRAWTIAAWRISGELA